MLIIYRNPSKVEKKKKHRKKLIYQPPPPHNDSMTELSYLRKIQPIDPPPGAQISNTFNTLPSLTQFFLL